MKEKRDFVQWLSTFKSSICDYAYYVNFEKVYKNVDSYKVELNIMNSLIGSNDIEKEFRVLVSKYPEILKCVPLLLAVREREIYAMDTEGSLAYDFKNYGNSVDDYVRFMHKTGLFDLISNHLVNNLFDYATGVEVGLDSNGRKNRGGHLMENVVESYIKETGAEYYKEMYLEEIEQKWNIDLSALSNNGKTRKRFDFVLKTDSTIYAIETNFYKGTGGGSKLNETARSYKLLAQEADTIDGFEFIWLTDGTAWNSAKGNLKETFDTTDNIYCLRELEEGALNKIVEE